MTTPYKILLEVADKASQVVDRLDDKIQSITKSPQVIDLAVKAENLQKQIGGVFDSIQDRAKKIDLTDGILKGIKSLNAGMISALDNLKGKYGDFIDGVKGRFDAIKQAAMTSKPAQMVKGVAGNVGAIASGAGKKLGGIAGTVSNAVKQTVSDLTEGVDFEEFLGLKPLNTGLVELGNNFLTNNTLMGAFGQGMQMLVGAISMVSPELGELAEKLTTLDGLYDLMIGQNVRLQGQITKTSAIIAGTNKVMSGGKEMTDPIAKLTALKGETKKAIDEIRIQSLELVGVTSSQLIDELLPIIAGQLGNINATMAQAPDLVSNFASAFQVLDIPLEQAQQEISSILTAQINSDSTLAKSLNITNQQVETYKAQGILVEKLNERLGDFRKANALASQSLEGVTSNIAEIFEVATQKAGEGLLKPLVGQINEFYKFLSENQGKIEGFFKFIGDAAASILGDIFGPLFEFIGPEGAGGDFFKVFGEGFRGVGEIAKFAGTAIGGAVQFADEFYKVAARNDTILGTLIGTLKLTADGYRNLNVAMQIASGAYGEGDAIVTNLNAEAEAMYARLEKIQNETGSRYKFLTDKQKEGLTLTAQEQSELAELTKRRQNATDQLNRFGEALANTNVVGEENQNRLRTMTTTVDILKKQFGEITTAARDLDKVGGSYEQLSKQVTAAQKTLKETGDPAVFEETTGRLIQLTQKQRELGVATDEELIARLTRIRQDNRVSMEQQEEAQQGIIQIQEARINREKELNELSVSAKEAAITAGTESEAKAQFDIYALKENFAQKELALIRQQITEEAKLRSEGIQKRIAELQKESTELAKKDSPEARKRQAEIAAETKTLTESLKVNSDRINQLKIQEQQGLQEIARLRAQERDRQQDEIRKDFQERSEFLQTQLDQRKISQEEFDANFQKSEEDRIKFELSINAEKYKLMAKDDREGQQVLRLEREKLLAEQRQLEEEFAAKQFERQVARIDAEIALSEKAYQMGDLSKQENAENRLALTEQRLDRELAEVLRQRSRINQADKDALDQSLLQEVEIFQKREEALKEFNDFRLGEIESAARKTLQRIKEIDTQFDLALAENQFKDEDENLARILRRRESIEVELEMERAKSEELSQISYDNPEFEKERKEQLRQSRLAIAQFTIQLAEDVEAREQAFREAASAYRRRQLEELGAIRDTEIANLEARASYESAIAESLERQLSVNSARRDLLASTASYLESQLGVLGAIAEKEGDTKLSEESNLAAAAVKLNALMREQEAERAIFEINLEQNKAKLEAQKLELELSKIKQDAAIAEAEARLADTEANEKSTPAQKRAAELGLRAAITGRLNLDRQGENLDRQIQFQGQQAQFDRQKQQTGQAGAMNNALLAYANSLEASDPQTAASIRQQLSANILGSLGGNQALTRIVSQTNASIPAIMPVSPTVSLDSITRSFRPVARENVVDIRTQLPAAYAQSVERVSTLLDQSNRYVIDQVGKIIDKAAKTNLSITQTNQFSDGYSPEKIRSQLYQDLESIGRKISST